MTTRKTSTAPVITLLGLLASFLVGFVYNLYSLRGSYTLRKALRWVEGKRSQQDLGPFHLEEEPGRWVLAKDAAASEDLTEEQREAMANLQTIGYLEGYEPATSSMGVTLHVPEIASPGFNLYSSGHGPIAVLTDMEGDILHSWKHANPFPRTKDRNPLAEFWRRVYLYENGDLLAIYDGIGLIKLDKASNLLWASPCGAHHDLEVDENGFIYVLTREAKMLARIDENDPIVEDFVAILDSHGNIVRKVSILEAFERSSYSSLLSKMPKSGDIMHTNTLELLDGAHVGRSRIFKKGNVLISVLALDAIAIIDMDEDRVVGP